MSSEQIILSDADYRRLGGDPETGGRIERGDGMAIHPQRLTDGTWALAPVALQSATPEAAAFLRTLTPQQVDDSAFQWRADLAAEAQPLAAAPKVKR